MPLVYVFVQAGFTSFRLPLACRSRSSMSMYLSVIALELCPASSRTCSLGLAVSHRPRCPCAGANARLLLKALLPHPQSHRLDAALSPDQNSPEQSPESAMSMQPPHLQEGMSKRCKRVERCCNQFMTYPLTVRFSRMLLGRQAASGRLCLFRGYIFAHNCLYMAFYVDLLTNGWTFFRFSKITF